MQVESGKSHLICFVSNNGWSVYNFRLDVIRSLLRAGHRVLVLCPADDYVRHLEEEGCQWVCLHFDNRSVSPLRDILLYRELKKIYRCHHPDLIFHFVAKPNIYGTMAAGSLGIPSIAVITGLGYAFSKKNFLYQVVRQLYTRALKTSREVWFLNKEDAGVFASQGIAAREKIKVLPGEGVNTNWFRPARERSASGSFCFLMASRLLRSKGIGVFADACRILKNKNYSFRSVLIGFAESHHPDAILPEDLQRWEQEGLLQYRGFAADVRPWLSEADCFVFPSWYSEGVPRSLMEAASMELPVITSNTRGCRDVVTDQVNGLLCQPHDPADLALKMEAMLTMDAFSRAEMGRKGRQRMCSVFDMEHIIAQYHQAVATNIPQQ